LGYREVSRTSATCYPECHNERDPALYSLTPTEEWSRVNDDEDGGRSIEPIEWTGGDEEFSVNMTDAEINSLKDKNGEIRYEKVF
jgi:hypothetical protein